MRIGVVSDTHDHLPNTRRIVEILNAERVARVVHTGDITQPKTLRALAALEAPLHGVFGNNDLERPALDEACRTLGLRFVDGPLRLEWAGRRIVVVHDPLELRPALLRDTHLALHGHDHRHRSEWERETLVFNPGECAGHLRGLNQVGVVDLVAMETRVVRF